jgi:hypothetical protein
MSGQFNWGDIYRLGICKDSAIPQVGLSIRGGRDKKIMFWVPLAQIHILTMLVI